MVEHVEFSDNHHARVASDVDTARNELGMPIAGQPASRADALRGGGGVTQEGLEELQLQQHRNHDGLYTAELNAPNKSDHRNYDLQEPRLFHATVTTTIAQADQDSRHPATPASRRIRQQMMATRIP